MHKIIHCVDSSSFGGSEQALLHILRGLDPNCWQSILFCPPDPALSPLLEGARDLGIPVRTVSRLAGTRVLTGFPKVLYAIKKEQPHIVHVHLQWPLACKYMVVAAALARVSGIVATSQLLFVPEYLPWSRLQYRFMAATVDRFIAVSRDIASQLQHVVGVAPNKICIVHNGIPIEAYQRATDAELRAGLAQGVNRPVVLTSARLEAQKGICHLLEAAVHVPTAVFLVAGDGPERQNLQLRARELGVSDRVLFLGHRRDIPDLLACCDVFVLPSFLEGLPLSILEAMAAGKPVIASAIGGIREAVIDGETGFLIPPANAVELARALNRILSDKTLAEQMGIRAVAHVRQQFSAETMVRGVTTIYEELLGINPKHPSTNGQVTPSDAMDPVNFPR